jgi:hypothetical protein
LRASPAPLTLVSLGAPRGCAFCQAAGQASRQPKGPLPRPPRVSLWFKRRAVAPPCRGTAPPAAPQRHAGAGSGYTRGAAARANPLVYPPVSRASRAPARVVAKARHLTVGPCGARLARIGSAKTPLSTPRFGTGVPAVVRVVAAPFHRTPLLRPVIRRLERIHLQRVHVQADLAHRNSPVCWDATICAHRDERQYRAYD